MLTDKERQTRGLDSLGGGLRPLVDDRMAAAAHGKPWLPLYEAKETARLRRPYRADVGDPRLMLRILRYERGVFTEVDASQRAWIDELIQASNKAAHASTVTRAEADRALETMALLADSLDLPDVVADLTALQALGTSPTPAPVPTTPSGITPISPAVPSPTEPLVDPVRPSPSESSPRERTVPIPAERVPGEDFPREGIRVLSARTGALDVVVLYREAVNFALVHNRVSPIAGIRVQNNGPHAIMDVSLTIDLDTPPDLVESPVAPPLIVPIGTVEPGDHLEIPVHQLAWRLNPVPFVALDEALLTGIHLTVTTGEGAEKAAVRDTADARLLTAEEWWALSIPESLAAFVRPNDPTVIALLTEASELLAARTGSPSLEGYQSGPERVHKIAEAVYDAMATRGITYVEAPSSFEGTGQRVRTHAQVLEERRGTCLDLACTYAAALEQAGIHPVIAVVKGHAFTGYLTEETELPAVALTDESAIVTVADSDVFDAVETTALCVHEEPIAFDQARGLVRRWWRAQLSEVAYLLDVNAAHRRVKPLPSIRLEAGIRVVEVVREAVQAPLRRVPATSERRDAQQASAPPRVQRWQRALLDMTYRNPLLKLKAASSTPVHVPSASLPRLEDKIADGQQIELIAHDELAAIHRAQGARTAADVDADSLRRIMDEENTLFVSLSQREYATRLRNLQRKARTTLEETGTDSLYLALGTLEWFEGARQGRAPLFLAPVRLTGGRGGTRFAVEFDDTRAMEPNYCLVEKLLVTWGLEIPELSDPGEDESGIDVSNALAAVRSALLRAKLVEFRVEETAHLALLQFSTIEMWRDLRENWSHFMNRPVVKHLVETQGQPFIDGIEPPAADSAAEATTYLPIPADGSQIEAVRWAAAGKSFILEGPPGTGKSQTITNLIAHCLAEGKKVLFVAEKQAALDIVKKRLDGVGLGAFSLDVHGKNQTVTAVRQQISDALDVTAPTSSSWEALRANYRALVESLARYPRHLHEAGPVDMSAWDARQVLLELKEAVADQAAVSLEVPRGIVMGQVELNDVYDAGRDLGNALMDLGVCPDQSPWRLAGVVDPAAMDRNAVARVLQELRESEAALSDSAVRDIAAIAATPSELGAIAAWLDSVHAGLGRSSGEAAQVVTLSWRNNAQHARGAVRHFREHQGGRLGDFLPGVLDLDLDGIVNRSVEADGRMFGKKKRRASILADLQHVMRGPATFPQKQLTAVLRNLATLRDEMRGLVQHVATLPGISLPYGWNPLDEGQADALDRAVHSLEVPAHLRAVLGASRPDVETIRVSVDRMTTEALSGPSSRVPSGDAVRRLDGAWTAFRQQLGSTDSEVARWLGSRTRGEALRADLQHWAADGAGGAFIGLQRWLRVRFALARLEALGLGAVTEPVRTGALRGADVENTVRLGVARAVLDERLDSTGLAGFDGSERGRLVERFLSSGEDVRERMVAELSGRIVRARTFDPVARKGDVAELRGQLGRRRGGMSSRRMLQRFGSLVTQITPCFLMSPASVARFLPADAIDFDVVVFDEASQIRVPEAIGAMGRGRAVVIVGDSKQMPPSSMFAAAGPSEDEEDELADDSLPVPVDLESILSEGVESRLPQLLLTWHYRSRDESLIAFSNSQYYEGRLSSFPTPPAHGKVPALHLRRVDGVWEGGGRGAARINRAEADAVVAEIRNRLSTRPERSIGVVTFNTRQRDHILNLLDEVRQRDFRVEEALSRADEPLFVKNLENVQGDERDAILFTLAFAADARGKVPLNWGPLSRAGGERRLNVAVTRAKEQVVVFCSFEPHELDLSRSTSMGLADLKDYLLAARNGIEAAGLRRAEARDLHLEDVERALRSAGLEVRTHIGLSDFTIDLAVRAGSERPWVAVMLDGPAWAGRGSVGDREGLPSTVLTSRMGWSRVERIWLPTWVRDAQPVVARVVAAASEPHATAPEPETVDSLGNADLPGVVERPTNQPFAVVGAGRPTVIDSESIPVPELTPPGSIEPIISAALAPPVVTASVAATTAQPRFEPASTSVKHGLWMLADHRRSSVAAIRKEIGDVVQTEGPVLEERLVRIVAARFDLSRVRETRRAQILACAPRGLAVEAKNGDVVYWPEGMNADAFTAYRLPDDKRDIHDVPYQELRNAMVDVVRSAHGMEHEDALRETARVFGVTRLGAKVRERLEGVLQAAARENFLTAQDERVFEA
ncbi:DUF4011 domain-containing protein [Bogoriella caseilytica]|nr:DUF4011 domain-containing protein [Bogoriella caseilytica]